MAAAVSMILSYGAQRLTHRGGPSNNVDVDHIESKAGHPRLVDAAARCYLLTVQMGLEHVVAAELKEMVEKVSSCVVADDEHYHIRTSWPAPGYVAITIQEDIPERDKVCAHLHKLRCIHDVLQYHIHFPIEFPETKTKHKRSSDHANDWDDPRRTDDAQNRHGKSPEDCKSTEADKRAEDDSSVDILMDSAGDNPKSALGSALHGNTDAEVIYQQLKHRLLVADQTGNCTRALIPTLIGASSFRVTSSRCGKSHRFNSKDVEFEAGGAVQEAYGLDADMTGYDVNLRVDVVGSVVVVGTQLNKTELSRRHKDVFVNRVTIKANVACAMLRLGQLKKGFTILDPFCGSATILLEAVQMTGGDCTCYGSDSVAATVRGAVKNVDAQGLSEQVHLQHGSVTGMSRMYERESIDLVCTNPPWGVQTGINTDLELLYRKFLSGTWVVMKPGGLVVVFVLRAMLFLEIVRTFGQFKLLSTQVVKTRNNLPTIFVLQRLPIDPEYDTLRTQLKDFSQYVNMDRGLFNTIHSHKKGGSKE